MNIELITYTPNPLGVIAFAKNMILSKSKNPDEYTREELEKEFIDCTRTALLGPFEFVHFVFKDSDVTRAYTHQKVRTRLAAYMQESMRFSIRDKGEFGYLVGPSINTPEKQKIYNDVCNVISNGYSSLINKGANIEDARGLLPTNIFTSIASAVSYSTLIHMAESRLCMQTQGEHREAMLKMKELITKVEPLMGEYLKPSCGHNGFCSWEGSLDRKCPLQKIYPFKSEVLKYSKEIKEMVNKFNE